MKFVLFLILYMTVNSSLAAVEREQADEEALVRRIQELGGSVHYAGEGKDRAIVKVYLTGAKVTDEDLAILKEFPQLRELSLYGQTQKSPPRRGGKITDKGLQALVGLTKLELLNLCGNRITDAGLKELQTLKNLRSLDLSLTDISDDGLRELQKFEHLEYLRIWDVKISDVGLSHLHKITSLKNVLLAHSQVTENGLARLRSAIPGIQAKNINYGR